MKVDRSLSKLVARYPGFRLDGRVIVSAAGPKLPVKHARSADPHTLHRIEKWLGEHADAARAAARQQAKYDRPAEADRGGTPAQATREARASRKRLDQIRETWPRLRLEEQVEFMRDAAVDLAAKDDRYRGLRQVMGV